jgi:hypothetical protein
MEPEMIGNDLAMIDQRRLLPPKLRLFCILPKPPDLGAERYCWSLLLERCRLLEPKPEPVDRFCVDLLKLSVLGFRESPVVRRAR